MKKITFIPLLLILFLVSACPSSTDTGTNPIPTTSVPPANGEQAPDDIVSTPGGYAYRANVHQGGVENPWPSIETIWLTLESSAGIANVRYRDYIETKAGEARNNILSITIPAGEERQSLNLNLYASNIPNGIVIAESMRWSGPWTIAPVLIVEVSQDIELGEYTFEISIEIDGVDYGCVPCTIKVIE